MSSTISPFQRNNLPNTKIRSEKTPPPSHLREFSFYPCFQVASQTFPPWKQVSNLNPGKDITDWQSQVSTTLLLEFTENVSRGPDEKSDSTLSARIMSIRSVDGESSFFHVPTNSP